MGEWGGAQGGVGRLPAILGAVWLLPLFPRTGAVLLLCPQPGAPSLLPQTQGLTLCLCSLSMFPQMMIMLGAICAIIVVVIVSKYR